MPKSAYCRHVSVQVCVCDSHSFEFPVWGREAASLSLVERCAAIEKATTSSGHPTVRDVQSTQVDRVSDGNRSYDSKITCAARPTP